MIIQQKFTPSPGDIIFPGTTRDVKGLATDFDRHGRLRVHASGRYLEHTDGTYFPFVATTAFWLSYRLQPSEFDTFFDAIRDNGCTACFTMLVVPDSSLNQTTVYNGLTTFSSGVAVPAYFDLVEAMILAAKEKGIYLLIAPLWANQYGAGSTNWFNNLSSGQISTYGAYLGRFASYNNIGWCNGGDYATPINGTLKTKINTFGAALRSSCPNHLITCHGGGPGTSGVSTSPDFGAETWYDFSGCQSSHFALDDIAAYNLVTTGYTASPTKPAIDLEPRYDATCINFNPANGFFNSFDARQALWWNLGAGAFGIVYTHIAIQQLEFSTDNFATNGYHDWKIQKRVDGFNNARHIKNFLKSRPGAYAPDQTIVVDDLSGAQQIVCAKISNSCWVYTPYGDNFTVNLAKISGSSVKAYWLNPRTGEVRYINTYTNSGTQAFDPPGSSTRGNDYVLILDDAAASFTIPGVVTIESPLPSELPLWNAALNNVYNGTSNARILFIGDSITTGSVNVDYPQNSAAIAFPAVIASMFPDNKGSTLSICGEHFISGTSRNYEWYDTRFSFTNPADWGTSVVSGTFGQILGGYTIASLGANNSPVNFKADKEWDTVEFYYLAAPGGGGGSLSVNGGSSFQTFSINAGANSLIKITATKTLGKDTLNITKTSGPGLDIEGVVMYNSAKKEVQCINAGWSGADSQSLVANNQPWATLNSITVWDPDLVVIEIGANDWVLTTPTSEANFKSAVQAVIDTAVAVGSDVLLIVPVPGSDSNAIAHMAAIQSYMHDLATTNDIPIIDFIELWASHAVSSIFNLMSDPYHPTVQGYQLMAQTIFKTIYRR
jgi:lysophospholipase L1-like esterase